MRNALSLAFVLAQTVCGQASAGEGWAIASPEFRKGGVQFVVCNDIPDQVLCLGLSCVGDDYELVSIRSGSGPFTGVAKISTASGEFRVTFSEDAKPIADVSTATRAKVGRDAIRAMAASRRFSIRETHPDPDTDRFSGADLARLIKKTKGACPPIE